MVHPVLLYSSSKMHRVEGFSSLSWFSSVLNRQKKPLDGKRKEWEGRESGWLLDFMFQLYVDGRMYEYVKKENAYVHIG